MKRQHDFIALAVLVNFLLTQVLVYAEDTQQSSSPVGQNAKTGILPSNPNSGSNQAQKQNLISQQNVLSLNYGAVGGAASSGSPSASGLGANLSEKEWGEFLAGLDELSDAEAASEMVPDSPDKDSSSFLTELLDAPTSFEESGETGEFWDELDEIDIDGNPLTPPDDPGPLATGQNAAAQSGPTGGTAQNSNPVASGNVKPSQVQPGAQQSPQQIAAARKKLSDGGYADGTVLKPGDLGLGELLDKGYRIVVRQGGVYVVDEAKMPQPGAANFWTVMDADSLLYEKLDGSYYRRGNIVYDVIKPAQPGEGYKIKMSRFNKPGKEVEIDVEARVTVVNGQFYQYVLGFYQEGSSTPVVEFLPIDQKSLNDLKKDPAVQIIGIGSPPPGKPGLPPADTPAQIKDRTDNLLAGNEREGTTYTPVQLGVEKVFPADFRIIADEREVTNINLTGKPQPVYKGVWLLPPGNKPDVWGARKSLKGVFQDFDATFQADKGAQTEFRILPGQTGFPMKAEFIDLKTMTSRTVQVGMNAKYVPESDLYVLEYYDITDGTILAAFRPPFKTAGKDALIEAANLYKLGVLKNKVGKEIYYVQATLSLKQIAANIKTMTANEQKGIQDVLDALKKNRPSDITKLWNDLKSGKVADGATYTAAQLWPTSPVPADTVFTKVTLKDSWGGSHEGLTANNQFASFSGLFSRCEVKNPATGDITQISITKFTNKNLLYSEIAETKTKSGTAYLYKDRDGDVLAAKDSKGAEINLQKLFSAKLSDLPLMAERYAKFTVDLSDGSLLSGIGASKLTANQTAQQYVPIKQWLIDRWNYALNPESSRLRINGENLILSDVRDGELRLYQAALEGSTSFNGNNLGASLKMTGVVVLAVPKPAASRGRMRPAGPPRTLIDDSRNIRAEYLLDGRKIDWSIQVLGASSGIFTSAKNGIKQMRVLQEWDAPKNTWKDDTSVADNTEEIINWNSVPGTSKISIIAEGIKTTKGLGDTLHAVTAMGSGMYYSLVGLGQAAFSSDANYRLNAVASLVRAQFVFEEPDVHWIARFLQSHEDDTEVMALLNHRVLESRLVANWGEIKQKFPETNGKSPEEAIEILMKNKRFQDSYGNSGTITWEERANILVTKLGAGTYGGYYSDWADLSSGFASFGYGTLGASIAFAEGTAQTLPLILATAGFGHAAGLLGTSTVGAVAQGAHTLFAGYMMITWASSIPVSMAELYEGFKDGDRSKISRATGQLAQDAVFLYATAKEVSTMLNIREARKIAEESKRVSQEIVKLDIEIQKEKDGPTVDQKQKMDQLAKDLKNLSDQALTLLEKVPDLKPKDLEYVNVLGQDGDLSVNQIIKLIDEKTKVEQAAIDKRSDAWKEDLDQAIDSINTRQVKVEYLNDANGTQVYLLGDFGGELLSDSMLVFVTNGKVVRVAYADAVWGGTPHSGVSTKRFAVLNDTAAAKVSGAVMGYLKKGAVQDVRGNVQIYLPLINLFCTKADLANMTQKNPVLKHLVSELFERWKTGESTHLSDFIEVTEIKDAKAPDGYNLDTLYLSMGLFTGKGGTLLERLILHETQHQVFKRNFDRAAKERLLEYFLKERPDLMELAGEYKGIWDKRLVDAKRFEIHVLDELIAHMMHSIFSSTSKEIRVKIQQKDGSFLSVPVDRTTIEFLIKEKVLPKDALTIYDNLAKQDAASAADLKWIMDMLREEKQKKPQSVPAQKIPVLTPGSVSLSPAPAATPKIVVRANATAPSTYIPKSKSTPSNSKSKSKKTKSHGIFDGDD